MCLSGHVYNHVCVQTCLQTCVRQMSYCKRVDVVVATFTLVVTLISSISIVIKAIGRLHHGVAPIEGDVMLVVAIR